MHQSFWNYRGYRYAIRATALGVLAILAYIFCPLRGEQSSGGTWLGYTLGTIAALLIVYLAWYGVRRRTFGKGGSAAGWLSAHVYFGLVLVLVATLHCGFQFGWNIHTAAYVLLVLVVASGCWGVYAYARYPGMIIRQRGNITRAELIEEIHQLDGRALKLASVLPADVHDLIADTIHRTQIGGSVWAMLRGYDESTMLLPAAAGAGARIVSNQSQRALIEVLAGRLAAQTDSAEIGKMHTLLDIVARKAALVGKLQKDVQLQGLIQFWLYLHLPLCFALLVALIAHIVAVFFYW
ncbi:MAG TPA: hypothetical protein VFS52_20305 [Steroidobacteraceae bacterium]|jgi:hypothetical protein|nr:hypothetical protein [Steroidobacteraceae bacterium]